MYIKTGCFFSMKFNSMKKSEQKQRKRTVIVYQRDSLRDSLLLSVNLLESAL